MNDFPKVIEFQMHNLCNADCIICPYREIPDKKIFMENGLFNKLLQEIGEREVLLIPYLNNEPFLDSTFCDKLEKVNQMCPNCKIEISTNLSFVNAEVIKRLEKINIYEFRISFFGYKEDTYKKMMPGLDYKKVWSNLQLLLKSNLKETIQKISITMIEHEEVEQEEYKLMKGLCNKNGIGFNQWGFLDRAGNNSYFKNEVKHERIIGCEQNRPIERMHILADGRVIICCQDWRKEVVLGSISENNIKEIWNGKKYYKIRESIYNRNGIELCKKCKLSITGQEDGKWSN